MPPAQAQLRSQRGSSAKPDPGSGVGMSPVVSPVVSPVSPPHGLSPEEPGFPMETQPGGRGSPRGLCSEPGLLPCGVFWGGIRAFGVKSEHFGVKSEHFWEFTSPAPLPVPGGQLDPPPPFWLCWGPHPAPGTPNPPQPFPGHKTQTCLDKGVTGWGEPPLLPSRPPHPSQGLGGLWGLPPSPSFNPLSPLHSGGAGAGSLCSGGVLGGPAPPNWQ